MTDAERRMLALERQWAQLGVQPAFSMATDERYRCLLSDLIDTPDAIVYAPITVSYLARKRDTFEREFYPERYLEAVG